MQGVVLIKKLSRIEIVNDDKVKINAIWLSLPQIRHANSNIAVTQMLYPILKRRPTVD
jgi:hypothetical protein